MGPEEKLVGGAGEKSECGGVEVRSGLSLVASYLGGSGQVLAFDRPTCYPCPALPGAVHIMLYASMVEASERTQSTSE